MAKYRLHQEPQKAELLHEILHWTGRYWFQLTIGFFMLHLYAKREVQVSVSLSGGQAQTVSLKTEKVPAVFREDAALLLAPMVDKTAELGGDRPARLPAKKWKSQDFKNLSFVLDPDMAKRKGVDDKIVAEKLEYCRKYVERFAATAISESKQFGIPASITLAQGLIETDAGGSRLASESNNHFGIKCRSKCRHCTCRNYSDDDVFDMFRVFGTAWESYREHSKLLQIDRYRHLKKLGTTDYEGWARGLKKAGYATDKNYDKKLIKIIEALDLHQFDQYKK
ncbi:MAG: glucosaminidase domain-containing protein [Bacteroidetes bacterium]|nr:glucosaminidase domain-containing protein [Bacteroidota bacterium]